MDGGASCPLSLPTARLKDTTGSQLAQLVTALKRLHTRCRVPVPHPEEPSWTALAGGVDGAGALELPGPG